MNSIFTEENLLAFTTAARFGSFSKAAEELGLTTSAISYTIKRMETGLDVVLFTRSTRSIELTESGRYFFRKATDLLNDFHAIKRSIDTISQMTTPLSKSPEAGQHCDASPSYAGWTRYQNRWSRGGARSAPQR